MQRLAIATTQVQGQQIELKPDQHHYLTRVLRLKSGDRFIAILESGQWWLAELHPEGGQAELLELIPVQTELPTPVTLMAALPKGNGFDEVVRCCTELGVTRIVPLLSERTLLQPSANKLERWRRIILEAAEQSQRQVIPELSPPLAFDQAMQASPLRGYICVTDPTAPALLQCLPADNPNEITVVIGPEGGWTAAEQAQAIAAGYQPVSLGRRVLRAVTAPVAALAIIAAKLELS